MESEPRRLRVLNLDSARFSCVYPTCGGGCCKESRPPIEPGEVARVDANLRRVLPLLRTRAKTALLRRSRPGRPGYLSDRFKGGLPTLAVVDRYCIFWNDGCALHKLGAAEGDKNRYKPSTCITFPLDETEDGHWYVRQRGLLDEAWNLPCLDPHASTRSGAESLTEEVTFATRLEAGDEAWRSHAPIKPAG